MVYMTTSPSFTGSVTLTLNLGWNGSTGVPGVDGSEGSKEPLLPKSDVGVSYKMRHILRRIIHIFLSVQFCVYVTQLLLFKYRDEMICGLSDRHPSNESLNELSCGI